MPPKKDKKKGKQKQDDYWDTDFQQDAAAISASTPTATATSIADPEELAETAKPAETADPAMDELAEEFGGLMAAIKKSQGKKGKKQQPVDMVDANEELEALEVETTTPATAQNGDVDGDKEDGEEQAGGEFRVKTKKEKEKEKKEKEKAKKKAQVSFTHMFPY